MSAAENNVTCLPVGVDALPPCGRPSGSGDASAQLWKRYGKTGFGQEIENELVTRYVPLVKTVAGRLAMHLPTHVDEGELCSAGLVGLLEAVRNFDGKRNFESYARIRIRGAMLDELRRMDWAPRSVHAKARKVQEAMAELEQRHGRVPEDGEVAAALGMRAGEYEKLLEEIRPATFVCLDAVLGDSPEEGGESRGARNGWCFHEVLADEESPHADEAVSRAELAGLIARGMERLPEFSRKVLALYYHEGLRVHEIAAATGFSRAHICQTHAKAILAVRAFVERCERKGL